MLRINIKLTVELKSLATYFVVRMRSHEGYESNKYFVTTLPSEYLEASFVARLGRPLVMTVDRMNRLLRKLGLSRSQIRTDGIEDTFLALLLTKG